MINFLTRKLGVASFNVGLLFTVYFAHFNNGMLAVLQGGLLPYIRAEYGLSYAQSGMLLSAHQMGDLSAVLLMGVLPFWLGKKKSVMILEPGAIVGFLFIALTGNYFMLIISYILIGVCRGTMSNNNTSVISDIAENRLSGFSILNACFAFGAILAPLFFVFGRHVPLDWRVAPYGAAMVAVVVFVMFARSSLANKPVVKDKGGSLEFLKTSNFWLNAGVLFSYLAAEATIIGWFQVYFAETGLLPANIASMTATLLWLMILIGRLSCAAVPAGANKNRLLLVLGLAFAVFFAGVIFTGSTVVAMVCLAGVGLSMAGIYPLTLATTNNTSSNMVTGALMAAAAIGAIAMPSVVGLVANRQGLTVGLSMVFVPLAVMMVLLVAKNLQSLTADKQK